MAYDFIVIGATGIQGKIASKDLLQSGYSVLMAGRNKSSVEPILRRYKRSGFACLDLHETKNISAVIRKSDADIVVNCADSQFNIEILEACLKTNLHYLDLGADNDDLNGEQFRMHNAFKKKGRIALTGCGSSPGITSIMAAYAAAKMDTIRKIDAGFAWNSNKDTFVVPYSISTIVREFTMKAPMIKNGRKVDAEPLSIIIRHTLPGVGKQISQNILHQEIYTFYRSFKEKGIKDIIYYCAFPESSFNTLMTLINLGLCMEEHVVNNGKEMMFVDVIGDKLKELKMPPGYTEKEDLWMTMYGKKDGQDKKIEMVCSASTLKGWEDATCNVDTGMPISIMAQMIKKGIITERGSVAPENAVPTAHFFAELAKRKMIVYENRKRIN